ncbi:MAG: 30S ribosomal protein S16 [Chloroflexi bacterium]|nr:30S ribosomal protein S16 [Chloroflexota bacterium]
MLRMRLRRVGSKNQPSYRIVVADSRAARDGAFVDYLGHYNPRTEPPTVVIDEEKARKWLSVGAKPSDAVQRIIDKMGDPQEAPTAEVAEEAEPEAESGDAADSEAADETETASAE